VNQVTPILIGIEKGLKILDNIWLHYNFWKIV
jgi:hypothetical protein